MRAAIALGHRSGLFIHVKPVLTDSDMGIQTDHPLRWDETEASLLEGLCQMALEGRTESSEYRQLAMEIYQRLVAAYTAR